ncbi:hypothetical protein ANCDUO_21988, partial [Ancylostoma duodenale]
TNVVLNELLEEDGNLSMEDSRMIDKAWKAAQAYHFLMLAQRQLYEGRVLLRFSKSSETE